MNSRDILAQNIDVLVFGPGKEKLIELLDINKPLVQVQSKRNQNKALRTKPESFNPSGKTEDLSKLHSTYYSKINKLQDLFDENKGHAPSSKGDDKAAPEKESETSFFTWGDFKKTTTTISTQNFWINVNFCLISDMFLDPYINSVIAGNLNILIITFNTNEKDSCKKAISLYRKLETDKPPSSIKYQSQRLLLQQGYYHSYNENIVLALCEMPNIEPLGKCLLVGFEEKGKKSVFEQTLKEMNVTLSPKVLIVEENREEQQVGEAYSWILEAHNKMKGNFDLEDTRKKELRDVVQKSFQAKKAAEKGGCMIF